MSFCFTFIAGWTRDCLLDWGSFIRLAVPGMLMMCIEWWTFEIGSFLAGEPKSSFSSGSTGHLPAVPALLCPQSTSCQQPPRLQGWFCRTLPLWDGNPVVTASLSVKGEFKF